MARAKKPDAKVTRCTYDDIKEPRTPETGHTMLMDDEQQVVRVSMDSGWKQALNVGKLADEPETVLIDMDPLIDPMLVWSGKKSTVDVSVLPLQRNEIVSESRIKQIIDRARRRAAETRGEGEQLSLGFAELEKELREGDRERRVEFYTHEEGWRNKLICGDSLHVMQSLLHYEGLRGKVQMVYIDPPYGISYDSNFQQRVDSPKNDQKERADDILTIKAFRDTWTLGIHSYLSYLRERLYLTRELLSDTGSVFVQMNQENEHLVRALLDEVFGAANFVSTIVFTKTAGFSSNLMAGIYDVVLWYARDKSSMEYHQLYEEKVLGGKGATGYTLVDLPDGTWRHMTPEEKSNPAALPEGARVFDGWPLSSSGETSSGPVDFEFEGRVFRPPPNNHWKVAPEGLKRLAELGRLVRIGNRIEFKSYFDEFPYTPYANVWLGMGERGFVGEKWYAVQTDWRVIQRCILMTTGPGDLVLDITCGSGTTAFAAENTGRRWITCDTSRVAVNVARTRLLSSLFDPLKLRGSKVSDGFEYVRAAKYSAGILAYDMEPEKIEILDKPVLDASSARVIGPLEVMTIGRYQESDWAGYVSEGEGLADYVSVVSRLYDSGASTDAASGSIHAVTEGPDGQFGISVGPLSGRVTAKQIVDAAQDAIAAGLKSIHVLGWAFEANVGEVKAKLESRGALQITLVMIRPDTLAEGLKVTDPAGLFSPLALPEVECFEAGLDETGAPLYSVALKGVGVFDRKTRTADFKPADSGYVSAWYLDEDYDGDCFVDCQMFFDFKKHPNLKSIVNEEIDGHEFAMRYESEHFPLGHYRMCAVKVVDVYGNESTVTVPLGPEA